ncbi:S-layer family protein [Nostoc sp. CHAB 5844]|nr:S-layer family protein [Nostoc sp. CHAB 5844]
MVLNGIRPPRGASVGGIVSFVRDGAIGNGGNVTINTGSLLVKDGTGISAESFGQGNAGNITINARETAAWDGTTRDGFFSSATSSVQRLLFPEFGFIGNAAGNGGTIAVTAKHVSLTNGARFDARIDDAPGQAGNIIIRAETVTLSGANLEYGNASSLITTTAGNTTAPGGEINIFADRLQISDGALLNATSQGNGRGGDIHISVNTLELQTGGELVTSAFGQGNAGDILVTAKDQIQIVGSDPNFLRRQQAIAQLPPTFSAIAESVSASSGLFANTEVGSTGQGGVISLKTNNLLVQDSGQISVSSQGAGIAGEIDIQANAIQLNNQGQLIAETVSGNGGNINLQVRDILLLRRNSLISATAGTNLAGGDGGNIMINAPFIVANQNSDIVANAFNGQGGRIDITATNIFELTVRSREDLQTSLNSPVLDPRLLPTSDISAISQTNPNLNGIITINALNIDPTQGVAELPIDLVDATQQINQQLCNISQKSSFIITGRGGLPETPSATLKPDATWEDWRILADESPPSKKPQTLLIDDSKIVAAQGWLVDAQGNVYLTAKSTSSVSQGCDRYLP